MQGRFSARAGRARVRRGSSYTKQSNAVTFCKIGGPCLTGPACSLATRESDESVAFLPSRSLPSQALDEAGPEAARILLRDNLRAFFPRSGSRILPQPAHVRQDE